MYSKKNIPHVPSKVNVREKESICKQNEKDRNTTPVLDVKTLASQGTSRKVVFISGTTPGAGIKLGEEWGDVTGGSDQRGQNRGRGAYDDRGCVGNVNSNRGIVVECMGKMNHGDELSGFVSGSNCGRGSWG